MIFSNQSLSEGKLRGRGGGALSRLANTLTNRVMFGPEGCRENGSFDTSLRMSRAGQIMISHLNGSFRASAARRVDSDMSAPTTNVPTAPMLTMSNLASCFAIDQGKEHPVEHPTFYRTVKIDGLSIFYREAGPKEAPTILLLHGLPSSSRMFEPLFARLSDRYHLVAPDYPGFGHSDWPDPKKF